MGRDGKLYPAPPADPARTELLSPPAEDVGELPPVPQSARPPQIDAAGIWAAHHANTRAVDVRALAGHLGVNAAALDGLGAARAPPHPAWPFLVSDGKLVRLRRESLRTSRNNAVAAGAGGPDADAMQMHLQMQCTSIACKCSAGAYAHAMQ